MTSGKCGENLTWTLDDDGTLTISGRGNMYKYSAPYEVPWDSSRELIRKVVLEFGVTTISKWAFSSYTGLTNVIISNSVTKIGGRAFYRCGLTNVIIPNSVTKIGGWAFCQCTALTNMIIPNSVTSVGDEAFSGCTGLKKVIIPDSVTKIGKWIFDHCTSLKEIYYKRGTKIGLKSFKVGNNAKLIPYDELQPAQVESPAQVEPPAQIEPPVQVESPEQVKPLAEINCTVYSNTKISRAENIALLNTRSLSRVDENIAEIRRAAELAAMNIVMTIERDLGFSPEDVSSQNLGYDIKSTSRDGKTLRLIEVKGRHIDSETVTVSRNEIDAALNNPDDFILAIVRLDGGNNETIYIRKPFEQPPDRAALSVNFSIQKLIEVSKDLGVLT